MHALESARVQLRQVGANVTCFLPLFLLVGASLSTFQNVSPSMHRPSKPQRTPYIFAFVLALFLVAIARIFEVHE